MSPANRFGACSPDEGRPPTEEHLVTRYRPSQDPRQRGVKPAARSRIRPRDESPVDLRAEMLRRDDDHATPAGREPETPDPTTRKVTGL
jgi:hypothetical protein